MWIFKSIYFQGHGCLYQYSSRTWIFTSLFVQDMNFYFNIFQGHRFLCQYFSRSWIFRSIFFKDMDFYINICSRTRIFRLKIFKDMYFYINIFQKPRFEKKISKDHEDVDSRIFFRTTRA